MFERYFEGPDFIMPGGVIAMEGGYELVATIERVFERRVREILVEQQAADEKPAALNPGPDMEVSQWERISVE